MKKTFQLQVPGKDTRRVLELVRGEVGKYLNREKRKALPEDHDREFACRVGADQASAVPISAKQLPHGIDDVAAMGATEVYVEILASAQPRPKAAAPLEAETESESET